MKTGRTSTLNYCLGVQIKWSVLGEEPTKEYTDSHQSATHFKQCASVFSLSMKTSSCNRAGETATLKTRVHYPQINLLVANKDSSTHHHVTDHKAM